MEIGTTDLIDMLQQKKKGKVQVIEPIELKYNLKCLNVGTKKIQIDSIRTDGIQASVVLRHQLVGNHKNNKAKESKGQKEAKKRKKETSMNEGAEYLVGIDPGIVTLVSCVDSDGKKWGSNKTYRHNVFIMA
ncbi:hypothetical protein D3C80_1658860 [compost metagenome]